MTAVTTTRERWKAAIRDLESSDIQVGENESRCCIKRPRYNLADKFGGGRFTITCKHKGGRHFWTKDGKLIQRFDSGETKLAERVHWYVSNRVFASRVADTFRRHGFTVDWEDVPNAPPIAVLIEQ